MLAGCGVSFLASLVGFLPIARSSAPSEITTLMGAMLLRLAAVVLLTVIVAIQGVFSLQPLVLWVGISYLAFLPADTYVAHRAIRTAR